MNHASRGEKMATGCPRVVHRAAAGAAVRVSHRSVQVVRWSSQSATSPGLRDSAMQRAVMPSQRWMHDGGGAGSEGPPVRGAGAGAGAGGSWEASTGTTCTATGLRDWTQVTSPSAIAPA